MREMRNFAPDVVITRGYNAEMLGRIAAWLTRVPHNVVWVHNYGDIEPRGAVRRIADRVLDRVTSAYFGLARAQIDYMVNDLKYSPDKIRIIHNGVDPDGFEWTDDHSAVSDLGIGESDKVVGIFAMLRPEKDHATFFGPHAWWSTVCRKRSSWSSVTARCGPRSKGSSVNSILPTAWC